MSYEIFVGTYTHNDSKSKGIYQFSFNADTGEAILKHIIVTENPSFISCYKNNIYAANELGDLKGELSVFQFNEQQQGYLKLQSLKTDGSSPCHIMISDVNKLLFVANYSSGSLSIYGLDKEGHVTGLIATKAYTGSGPNRKRQTAAHIHSAFLNPKENKLFVQDLGSDKIYVYNIKDRKIEQDGYISAPPGSGPRHLAISADDQFIYVLLELTAEIAVFKNDPAYRLLQLITINKPGFKGYDCAAEIRISPDGNFLYATNRGEANVMSTYAIHKGNGTLLVIDHDDVLGVGPRNFNFSPDGNLVFVGNQHSDEIVVFRRNQFSGKLMDTGFKIAVPQPVCVLVR